MFLAIGAKSSMEAPHIVIFAYPAQGRLIPLMTLASHLASMGAEVSILCVDSWLPKLREAKSRGFRSGIHLIPLHVSTADTIPTTSSSLHGTRESAWKMFCKLDVLAEKFEEYLTNGIERPPTCLIIDEVSAGVARVAKRSGIPRYAFCPQRALSLATSLYAPVLNSQGRIPIIVGSVTIPGISEPISSTVFPEVYKENPFLKDFIEAAALACEADGLLVNTFEELEPEALGALRTNSELNPNSIPVFAIGPLLPTPDAPVEEDACIKFLDAQAAHSVVFVAFGTILELNEQQACTIAAALKSCKKPFIWMLRDTPLPMDIYESITGGEIPGLVMRGWASQIRILAHPSTGVFFSHCGWNSTLESLACGVPMVACPHYIDQHLNCKLVVESLGVGVRLHTLDDANEVEKAISMVLGSQHMKKRTKEVKEAAMRSASAGDQLKTFMRLIA